MPPVYPLYRESLAGSQAEPGAKTGAAASAVAVLECARPVAEVRPVESPAEHLVVSPKPKKPMGPEVVKVVVALLTLRPLHHVLQVESSVPAPPRHRSLNLRYSRRSSMRENLPLLPGAPRPLPLPQCCPLRRSAREGLWLPGYLISDHLSS